jgi:SAM-dependent methyltransferase
LFICSPTAAHRQEHDMTIPDSEQHRAWNGHEGRHWADYHDRYDAVSAGFNDLVLQAASIGPDHRVLDIGCGTGQITREAARLADMGEAVGVDLSAPMLERARAQARTEGPANVTFLRADAQVHPFPPATFDVAISRFGIMFFSDPIVAFANIGAALRPGGRLAFVCMRPLRDHDLGVVLAPLAAGAGSEEGDPSDRAGPFSLADPAVVTATLVDAGYADVTTEGVDAPQWWGRDVADAMAFLSGWGPIRHTLHRLDPDAADRALDGMRGALASFAGPRGVLLRGAAWLVTAVRP